MRERRHVTLMLKGPPADDAGGRVSGEAQRVLGVDLGHVRVGTLFHFTDAENLDGFVRDALADPLIHEVHNDLPSAASTLIVAKKAGVTDDEGVSAQKTLCDYLHRAYDPAHQTVFTQQVYLFDKAITPEVLQDLATQVLGNPLIHHFTDAADYVPDVNLTVSAEVETFDLEDLDLAELSSSRHLCLNAVEMEAIRAHFDRPVTDCELEVLAQTWSEHCKHKEFSALIDFRDLDSGATRQIDGLFKTFIQGSTHLIKEQLESRGYDWLVKVFSDNAGVVRIDEDRLFVWKVETHNTPSALDPYGGAITGILGNNRDAIGTGVGGARLLFNTNVLCFAPPTYDKPLLRGQLHPKRVMEGVVEGIMDGGNKSGVPTVNGATIFDDRFCGKPLVFCGTGALMPPTFAGVSSWKKPISPGDAIVMAGGRVGKDGIHGATLSSSHIDANTPQTVVQIGSPFTQKLVADFLSDACKQGLVRTCTDNGAGGLSSSIGEMAEFTGGAEVWLHEVPLKYSGLQPWEIFVSESQERMTLVVAPSRLEALFALAASYEVELSHVGRFNDSGRLTVFYSTDLVADLDLDFLHNGVPRKHLIAEWKAPVHPEPPLPDLDCNAALLDILSHPTVCSKEAIIRRYDHEVQGRTVVKPLMGPTGHAPQDAAVVRLDHDGYTGLAVSNGIIPRYGDIDAYQMSAGAFDEAVRQIIAVGGSLHPSSFWSVNDNFCVPDSVYDPITNPDGKYKLAQLVRMCEALYDMSTAYLVPMTSGKDSMKNDFRDGTTKISVPPTILYSMVAKIDDIRDCTTAEFKAPGDWIYLLGDTYDELGGSILYETLGTIGNKVPKVRPDSAIALYNKVSSARPLIASCHDLSDGGLAVALAESSFGSGFGAEVEIPGNPVVGLFSESHSRFLVSVADADRSAFEAVFGISSIGRVLAEPRLHIKDAVDLPLTTLLNAWRGGLS